MLTSGDKLVFAAIAIVSVGAVLVLCSVFSFVISDSDDRFGLSSTMLTVEEGDDESLTVWVLPAGCEYKDIEWSSSDETTVTVSGGTVTGVKAGGSATVTATVSIDGKTFTDECLVTVCETGAKTDTLKAYDAYSENMDYAVLSGDGFEDGYLALTFNAAGHTIVSLAGYDPSWLNISRSFIGSATKDFDSATMTIRSDSTVITREYTRNDEESGSYNLLMSEELPYGSYDVEFTLRYSSGFMTQKNVTVSGHFEYREGDGYRDVSGTYPRAYAWRCDADDSGAVDNDETFSTTLYYKCSDYWKSYCSNSMKVFETDGVLRNAHYEMEIASFCTIDETVSGLCSELTRLYEENGNSTDDRQLYAQFILTFLQSQYGYELDLTQNGDGDDEKTVDYWAFATETVYSGFGDCEDTSILYSSLCKSAGFEAGMMLLPSHAMSCIALEDYTSHGLTDEVAKAEEDGLCYYFCETTAYSPVLHAYKDRGSTVVDYLLVYNKANLGGYRYYLVGMANSSQWGEEFSFYAI